MTGNETLIVWDDINDLPDPLRKFWPQDDGDFVVFVDSCSCIDREKVENLLDREVFQEFKVEGLVAIDGFDNGDNWGSAVRLWGTIFSLTHA